MTSRLASFVTAGIAGIAGVAVLGLGAVLVSTAVVVSGVVASAPAHAADQAWHADLETGVKAARKSGKPLLVVTAWKSGI